MKSPDEVPHPRLWCRTLGGLTLHADRGSVYPLMEAGKPLAVLVYLALSPKQKASRDHVAELLWPGCDLTDARHSLRQTLYRLREATDAVALVRAHGTELELLPTVAFDCLEGEHLSSGDNAGEAFELLRGNFLDGFAIPESPEFERWAEASRVRFRDLWAQAATRLVQEHLRTGDGRRAVEIAEELAGRRPLSDEPMHLLMTALAETGRHATAVARFRAYAELLQRELEAQPAEALDAYARELERFLRSRPEPGPGVLPFVGRTREWATVEAAWRRVEQGRCVSVLIEGAAGVGKTRILAELSSRVRASGGLVLGTKCYEIERTVPYAVVGEALAAAASRPELERVEPSWLADAARLLPELNGRFGVAVAGGVTAVGHAAKRRLHEGMARCVEALGTSAPILIAVDDIHWADGPSLEVLHFLSHRLRTTKTLLVGTYRPAELNPAARQFARSLCAERLAELVVLEPLTAEAVCELLMALGRFESAEQGRQVAEHLHRHTGGNPLFLQELLDSLERGKILAVRDGTWRAAPDVDVPDLPRTLGKLLTDRVDSLSPWMRAGVETLAVSGEEATVEGLAAALQVSEPRVELALGVLEEERLVRRVGPGTFELIHDELRRLVYQGIPDERRRLLHLAVGAALEGSGEAKRPGGAARLAQHFDQAGERERAHRYALLAAGAARVLAGPEAERVHLELAEAHALKALPPHARIVARRRRRRVVLSAIVGLGLAGGGLAAGSIVVRAGYRQGTLYLARHEALQPTHRVRWGWLSWPTEVQTFRDGVRQSLFFFRGVTEAGQTHSKLFRALDGDTAQLTFGRSDDHVAEGPPQGRFIVMLRGWRATPTRYQQNVFLLDSNGQVIRPLTDTKYQDHSLAWSPTGTRIAFQRDSAGVSTLWMADADGSHLQDLTRRFRLPAADGRSGFSGDGRRLAVLYPRDGSESSLLYLVDLEAQTARAVGLGPLVTHTPVIWSPDGRWIAYVADRGDGPKLEVVPADGARPPTIVAALTEELRPVHWTQGRPRFVDAVSIQPDSLELRQGQGVRAHAVVRLADGRQDAIPLRWLTTDTAIARVDDLGFVRGVSPGVTHLVASAGGFRADTVPLSVLAAPIDTLLLEDWGRGLDTSQWMLFGSPRPRVVSDPTRLGRRAFWSNGDYNHSSGAISMRAFELGADGLTLQVEGWLGFTGGHWQHWTMRLGCDPPRLDGPELFCGAPTLNVEGPSPTIAAARWHCSGPDRGWGVGWGRVSRRWHVFALQIRPDGYSECLVDGRLLERARVPPDTAGRAVRVVLGGLSVATGIYHGRVVLTRGLRY